MHHNFLIGLRMAGCYSLNRRDSKQKCIYRGLWKKRIKPLVGEILHYEYFIGGYLHSDSTCWNILIYQTSVGGYVHLKPSFVWSLYIKLKFLKDQTNCYWDIPLFKVAVGCVTLLCAGYATIQPHNHTTCWVHHVSYDL